MINFIIEKLKEKSTIAGIVGLIGLGFSQELGTAVIEAVLAFVAVVAIVIKEKK